MNAENVKAEIRQKRKTFRRDIVVRRVDAFFDISVSMARVWGIVARILVLRSLVFYKIRPLLLARGGSKTGNTSDF